MSLRITFSRAAISLIRDLYRANRVFNSISKIELLTLTVLEANFLILKTAGEKTYLSTENAVFRKNQNSYAPFFSGSIFFG